MNWVKSLYKRFYLKDGISIKEVKDFALRRVPGEILNVSRDYDDGILTYKVYIITPENKIFEVKLLGKDGRILKVEEEDELD